MHGMRISAASSTISAVVRSAAHARITGLSSSLRSVRADHRVERAVVGPVGAADHGAEVEPVLDPVDDREADVAVLRRARRRPPWPGPASGGTPSTCVSIVCGLNSWVIITASRPDRSMTPPPPLTTIRRRPISVATAANTPTMYSPCWPPADIGGHARDPRRPGAPGQRLQRELGGGPVGPRPVEAERRQRGDRHARGPPPAAARCRRPRPATTVTASYAAARAGARRRRRSTPDRRRRCSCPPASQPNSGPAAVRRDRRRRWRSSAAADDRPAARPASRRRPPPTSRWAQ